MLKLPRSFSTLQACAAAPEYAYNASSTVIASRPPIWLSDRARRVTMKDTAASGCPDVTGRSELPATPMPGR